MTDPDGTDQQQSTPPLPPPPPPPPAAGKSTPRRHRPLTVGVAAAVAGAMFGGAVGVPTATVLLDQPASTGDELVEGDEGGRSRIAPPQNEPWTGGRGGDFPGASATNGFEAATAGQATGVMVIDVRARGARGAGTGWVLDDSGIVATNYHVVARSAEISVTDPATGTSYDATVLGHDATSDVAVLQLEGASGLQEVDLDDDGDPAEGEEVTAVGNAGGGGSLVTSSGSVTDLEEDIEVTDSATGITSDLAGLIETDAYVVRGFSGGVLLDDESEVVGITTAASGDGPATSYAVPIDDALAVIDQIREGEESGAVQIGPSPYLGISVVGTGAVEVAGVEEGGAAGMAGVTPGSVITTLGDRSIGDFADLERALADAEPGDRIVLGWTDPGGAEHEAAVVLGESPVN